MIKIIQHNQYKKLLCDFYNSCEFLIVPFTLSTLFALDINDENLNIGIGIKQNLSFNHSLQVD